MLDPLSAVTRRLEDALFQAFALERGTVDPAVRRSVHADYQANVAMALAKKLGKNPRQIAQAIVAVLDVSDLCEPPVLAGPGFINLTLRRDVLAASAASALADARLGVPVAAAPETVVIDYSSPNVAKEMHVGHLRTTVIGDALGRTLEFLGHRVVRQNHLGDWGTPFGMLIEHLLDIGAGGEGHAIGDLNEFYKQARAKFDADPAFAERSRGRVVLLQAGDAPTRELWRTLVAQSQEHFRKVYASLGVALTDADVRGESFYNPMLADVAADLEKRAIAVESDGALCVFAPGFTNREGEPLPLIVRKQDGGFGYAATDLAAVRYRVTELGATRVLYVVGAPQQQHLGMVFEVAKLAGYLGAARAEHVAFGSILGADKKMYKTRSGETVKLSDLIAEANERARAVVREKNPALGDAACAQIAEQIGVGAIKYADLSSDRIKDYVFDWDRMLALQGNTGPYLMYAHARIRSILRNGAEDGGAPPGGTPAVDHPAERALAMELLSFAATLRVVESTLEPHHLTTYLFDVATAYTSFYEKCPVLKADSPAERASRLALCALTASVLRTGLGLLGMVAPERM